VCGCGCGSPVPEAPARGGRSPAWATNACRQRAYRRRTAVRSDGPIDPPSVAPLLAAIRDLAGTLDSGQTPTATGVAAVRDGTNALLARVGKPTSVEVLAPADRNETIETNGSTPGARRPQDAQSAAPTDRHATIAPTGPAHATSPAEPTGTAPSIDRNETNGRESAARAPSRAGRAAVSDRHETNDLVDAMRATREALEAAVRAVRTAPPDVVPAFVRASDGGWTVVMGDVPIGVLQPTYGVRSRSGWEARDIASMASRGQHPTRAGAALLLTASLLRRPDIAGRPDDVTEATVRAWREAGETWAQIGARVGLSARAASKRWGQTATRRG